MKLAKHPSAIFAAALLLGCGHSDGFDNPATALGPFNAGADVRLTLNGNQDYWPIWTEDGRGILYSYVDVVPGPQHRCIGLVPSTGGTRAWQLCDNRSTQTDSVNGFLAYALGADGRLLYAEAVSRSGAGSTAPAETTLWLADSAAPFARRQLLTLPTFAGSTPVSWLADINWTGPTTFIGLAQDFAVLGHCKCAALDTIYFGQAVVRGTIAATGATLQAVPGTSGATSYSLAESGGSIVFTLRNDRQLYKVPVAGGTAAPMGAITASGGAQLLGVSCRASTCVVAVDPVTLSGTTPAGDVIFGSVNLGPAELRAVSLATGLVQVVRTGTILLATPQISPVTGDVVAQVGGAFGHLQSFTTSGSDLHLYQGLVQ